MNALWCKAPFLSEDKKSDSCRRPRDVSFENVCVKPVLVSSHGGGCRRSFLTPTFTVVIAKMVNFGINLPKRGIPLSDFFYTKFGFGRESQVRTLMPNFTVVALMALKMWAYSPQNHHNWYFLVQICQKWVYTLKQLLQNLAWEGSPRSAPSLQISPLWL